MSEAKAPYVNPKDLLGITKFPLHLIPPAAQVYESLAFLDGALKYGPYNWREKKVVASIYVAALLRHALAWYSREECALDSRAPHLGHIRACAGILADAEEQGCLVDDRPQNHHTDDWQRLMDKWGHVIEYLNQRGEQ